MFQLREWYWVIRGKWGGFLLGALNRVTKQTRSHSLNGFVRALLAFLGRNYYAVGPSTTSGYREDGVNRDHRLFVGSYPLRARVLYRLFRTVFTVFGVLFCRDARLGGRLKVLVGDFNYEVNEGNVSRLVVLGGHRSS